MTNILDFLPNYPDIDDEEFYQKIYNKQEFYELKLSKEYIQKDEMDFLEHQKFISRIMSSYTLYNSLLLFHSMGTGKSGVAFATSERILKDNFGINKIFVFTNSKDVLNNLKDELIFKFSNSKYIPEDFNILSKRQKTVAIKNILKINNYFFEQFHYIAKEVSSKKINPKTKQQLIDKYSNSFFILDEIHNIKDKLKGETNINKYGEIKELLEMINNKKILLMTGTPMKDQSNEITSILNLILPKEKQFVGTGSMNQFTAFDKKYMVENKLTNNIDEFKDKIKGKISYLKNISNINKVFKGKIISQLNYFKVFELQMTGLQLEKYKEAYEKDTSNISMDDDEERAGLYNNSRQSINAVFPDGSYGSSEIGQDSSGFNKYIDVNMGNKFVSSKKEEFGDLENLKGLSIKYYEVIRNIQQNNNMCHFVYSKLVNGSGIILLTLLLEKFLGYKRYQPKSASSPDITIPDKRYILLSSDSDWTTKKRLIREFNKEENKNGDNIKIIFGTYVIKEGLSFFNVQKVHILTPHWNYSETEQIIARAIRYDSHKYLPKDIQIEIILYVCNNTDITSIDVLMYKKAEDKDVKIKSVEKLLKESAIDCQLFKDRNIREGDYSRDCDYELCEYVCKDIDLNNFDIDKTTKNIYYNDDEMKTIIRKLYKKYFYLKLSNLINFFTKNTTYEILITMNYFIENNIFITNKYGIKSYIKEDNDIFYLTEFLSEDNENLCYTYNHLAIRHLDYDIFNNKYIFEKLANTSIDISEKTILLKYLDSNIIQELIKNSVLILRNKQTQTDLCKFILDIYQDKYDQITLNSQTVFIITYKDILCLWSDKNVWEECDQINKLFEQAENDKIQNSITLNLTHYGIIKTTNKYEKPIFIIKTLPSKEQIIDNFDLLKSLCDGKTKFVLDTDNNNFKSLTCKPKDVSDQKVILKIKKKIITINNDFAQTRTVIVDGNSENLIKLSKQVDARLINRGKECMNYPIEELKDIMKDKITFTSDNKREMCTLIEKYFTDNNLILYDKLSNN